MKRANKTFTPDPKLDLCSIPGVSYVDSLDCVQLPAGTNIRDKDLTFGIRSIWVVIETATGGLFAYFTEPRKFPGDRIVWAR